VSGTYGTRHGSGTCGTRQGSGHGHGSGSVTSLVNYQKCTKTSELVYSKNI